MLGIFGRTSNVLFGVYFTLRSCVFAGGFCTLGSFASDMIFLDGIVSDLPNKSEIMSDALFTSLLDFNTGVIVEGGFFMMEKISVVA